MTCIVALRAGRSAWIGGDAALTESGEDTGQILLRTPKVRKLGAYLVGVAGAASFDTLIGRLRWPAKHRRAWIDHEFASEFRALARVEGVVLDGEAIIVAPSGMWFLDDSLGISKTLDPFAAIGSGSYVALGALHATKRTPFAPSYRVRLALQSAARFDSCVRPPFTVLSC